MTEHVDLLLTGATVVDGTGAPGRRADVAVRGDRIVGVGTDLDVDAAETVALDGLVLSPGFIDPHTHYDAQVLWDRDVTPSSWHGVTTVVMGNCGFGIAPTRPEHREIILRTLENVEGMPLDALEAGLPWTFETFPEYLDALDAEPTRLNLAVLFGHTPLRFYVMGTDATERPATEAEVAEMKALLAEGLESGAVGLSSSRTESHIGAYGKPVPSRLADLDEIRALAGVLGEQGKGTFESTWGPDLFVEEFADIAKQIDRPVSWAALMTVKENPGYSVDVAERVAAAGGLVRPQVACKPIIIQITLADPAPFANVPAFGEILALERADRPALYADAAWRERAWEGMQAKWGQKLLDVTVEETSVHQDLANGPTLGQLAAERGVNPVAVMADLALAEDLDTRFRMVMVNDDPDQIAALLQDPNFLLGLSDAGAHTSQLCDANYATHLLALFHRERSDLSLEQAVWRLTGQPAEVYGLSDRGRIAEGLVADLVAFDPATVGSGPARRVVDFPGGADRLVADSTGVPHVWVRGTAIRRDGHDLDGVRPGGLLREFA
jgi:N-acyl-D-amino-acid deacylase